MTDNMNFEYLPLSDQGYVKGATGKVTTILMLVMRIKYEFDPSAMEIDEKIKLFLQEPPKYERSEEEGVMIDLRNESEAKKAVALLFSLILNSYLMLTPVRLT